MMKLYKLVFTIFSCSILSLRCMEKPIIIPEISEKDIEEWIESLNNGLENNQINLTPPLVLEPIIHEPVPEKQFSSIDEIIKFFEESSDSSDSSSKFKSPKVVIKPTKLSPIDRILKAIRASDYASLLAELQQTPEVVNEKKPIRICNLLKPKNCKKPERFLQEVTPLLFSCYQKNKFMVMHLLEHNADPNLPGHKGITPLLVASYNECNEIADTLLRAGADYDKSDANNNKPLNIALERKNIILINLLKKRQRTAHKLPPPLTNQVLTHAKKPSALSIYYQQQREWLAQLFSAIDCIGKPFEVYTLTRPGTIGDINGLHLIQAPSIYSQDLSTRMLTPLHYATYKDNLDAIKILLAHGANPNVLENYGVTPLVIAAARGRSEAAHSLLLNGADKTIRENLKNLTPAEIAKSAGKDETFRMIMYYPS